jgi:hypothetical protein
MARGKIILAVKDENGGLYEITPEQQCEDWIDAIFWIEEQGLVDFKKVIFKKDNKITFYAEINT